MWSNEWEIPDYRFPDADSVHFRPKTFFSAFLFGRMKGFLSAVNGFILYIYRTYIRRSATFECFLAFKLNCLNRGDRNGLNYFNPIAFFWTAHSPLPFFFFIFYFFKLAVYVAGINAESRYYSICWGLNFNDFFFLNGGKFDGEGGAKIVFNGIVEFLKILLVENCDFQGESFISVVIDFPTLENWKQWKIMSRISFYEDYRLFLFVQMWFFFFPR